MLMYSILYQLLNLYFVDYKRDDNSYRQHVNLSSVGINIIIVILENLKSI